jgi:hypothetical protein
MHAIFRVIAVKVERPYVLDVSFDDGATRRIDLEAVLYGEVYGPLRDAALFSQVSIDPEAATLVWPNGADFDPEILHDWDEHKAAFAVQARRWREVRSA